MNARVATTTAKPKPEYRPEVTTGWPIPYLLRRRAELQHARIALNVNDEATLTYGDWSRRADGLARGLVARGVTFGDVVGLMFDDLDWIDYAVAYIGVLKTGATAMHLNRTVGDEECLRRLRLLDVGLVLRGEQSEVPSGSEADVITVAGASDGDDSPFDLHVDPSTISDILFTSATTGLAKAITTPHGNLTYGRGPEGFHLFGDPEPLLSPMRLGTTASATTMNFSIHTPSTLVLCPHDDADRMAQLIEKHRIGSVMITPWITILLLKAKVGRRYDFSCVETLANASSALPPAHARRLLEMMPNAHLNVSYACSEAVPASVGGRFDPEVPTATGRPTRGSEVRIADPDGNEVPTGELGEIWLRNPAPKRFYYETVLNERVHVERWTRTGDLGCIDETGMVFLFDRATVAARTAEGLISTIRVEEALFECDSVLEAAAFGVGPDGDQVVEAAVVLEDPSVLPDLERLVGELLEGAAVPRRIHVVDTMPRGTNGKVIKKLLREELGL